MDVEASYSFEELGVVAVRTGCVTGGRYLLGGLLRGRLGLFGGDGYNGRFSCYRCFLWCRHLFWLWCFLCFWLTLGRCSLCFGVQAGFTIAQDTNAVGNNAAPVVLGLSSGYFKDQLTASRMDASVFLVKRMVWVTEHLLDLGDGSFFDELLDVYDVIVC